MILLILFFIGCGNESMDFDWQTETKITFINETSDSIRVEGSFDCVIADIAPYTTYTHTHTQSQSGTTLNDRPTVENLEVFIPCDFYYGNSGKCEMNINSKNEWENFLGTANLEFEFTFRFSEIKKENTISCE